MKTKFTPKYITDNRGCYSPERVAALPFMKQKSISLRKLFTTLPIKDFTWFLAKKCELTIKQKVALAIHCAEFVVPIYEARYPNDLRVRECVQAVKDFEAGKITREQLLEKRAYAAAYAAYAAYAAAAAAYAAAYADADADADAAYAAAAYAYAAYAAYAAADADDADAYREHIWKFVEQIVAK